ncbi:hypothetical protein K501DRAFT_218771 [Backusella circina FSU 941]|nr:hypothetical protein K501DRAFT_218771 [Backusella circina FSU 941]
MYSTQKYSITVLLLLLFTIVTNALPVHQVDLFIPEAGFLLTESLAEYYEDIVDQVMLDVSESIMSYLPGQLSHGNVEARQHSQKSMDRNLNFMRASLLASVNPLVATDIPQISGLSRVQNEAMLNMMHLKEEESEEKEEQGSKKEYAPKDTSDIETALMDSITALNKKVSHQLGLIVNAEQSSAILTRQAVTAYQSTAKTPSVVTVEWSMSNPFQVNVVRESEASDQEQDISQQTEWLYEKLSSIEASLLTEFDDRAQDAVQLVIESLDLA